MTPPFNFSTAPVHPEGGTIAGISPLPNQYHKKTTKNMDDI